MFIIPWNSKEAAPSKCYSKISNLQGVDHYSGSQLKVRGRGA